MPPITWQNVNAPSRSRSASDFGSVNNMITGGFDAIGDALITRQADLKNQYDTKVDKNTDNYLDAVANINTLDALNSDQTAAQLAALRNAGPIDQDAIRGALDTQRTSLMDRTNTRNTFDLGQAKLAAKPLVSQFNQAIANLDGNAAAKILTENPEALRSADALADMQKQLSDFTLEQREKRANRVVDTITGLLASDDPKDIAEAKVLQQNNSDLLNLEGLAGSTSSSIYNRDTELSQKSADRVGDEITAAIELGTEAGNVMASKLLSDNEALLNRMGMTTGLQNQITSGQDKLISIERGDIVAQVAADGDIANNRFQAILDKAIKQNPIDKRLTLLGEKPTLTNADIDATATGLGWDVSEGLFDTETGVFSDRKATKVYDEVIAEESKVTKGFSEAVKMQLLNLAVADLGQVDDDLFDGGENDIDDVKERIKGNYRNLAITYSQQQKGEGLIDAATENLEMQKAITSLNNVQAGLQSKNKQNTPIYRRNLQTLSQLHKNLGTVPSAAYNVRIPPKP